MKMGNEDMNTAKPAVFLDRDGTLIEDVNYFLNAVDVGILTSIGSEANSRAVLEFMSCGKPVIASDVGVIPEIIEDGINGLVFPKKDSQTLTESLTRLFYDNKLRYNLGIMARERILRKFSIDKFVQDTEKVYEKAKNLKMVK